MNDIRDDNTRLKRAVRISVWIALGLAAVVIGIVVFVRLDWSQESVEEPKISPTVVPMSTADIPTIAFSDVTEASGIDFVHENGAVGERFLPETMGGGVALFDFDNDDDLDLLFINSTSWPQHQDHGTEPATSVLYENHGSGQFEAVSEDRLNLSLYGMAPAIGDFNGDGFADLFVTAVGSNKLFMNDGGQRFVDVTEQFGVGGNPDDFSSCATFLDYDRDDDLDLFVCNYVGWSMAIDREVDFRLTGVGRAYGPPTDFPGSNSVLYRNDGDVFTDVSTETGIELFSEQSGQPVGKALAVASADINQDGWLDLVVANDTVRNFAFINQQDGTFDEEGIKYGLAFDPSGAATGAMGLDVANYANDGRLGVAIGNFANEMSSFYVSSGNLSIFSDDAIVVGIGASTRKVLTFGLFFFDVDLDGRVDLFSANGHIEPEISAVQASQSYAQKPQLFWNCGAACSRIYQIVPSTNTALDLTSVARGAVYGDLDNDGDLDIVLTNVGDKPRVLRNDLNSQKRLAWRSTAI